MRHTPNPNPTPTFNISDIKTLLRVDDVLLVTACKCTDLVVSQSGMNGQVQPLSIQPTNQFDNHMKDYQSCCLKIVTW